jgi:hypothetical protein
MERKLALLAQEFNELPRVDASLPLDERHGCSVMLARRLWKFSLFSALERREEGGVRASRESAEDEGTAGSAPVPFDTTSSPTSVGKVADPMSGIAE